MNEIKYFKFDFNNILLKNISYEAKDLMHHLLQVDPHLRFNSYNALNHIFFDYINILPSINELEESNFTNHDFSTRINRKTMSYKIDNNNNNNMINYGQSEIKVNHNDYYENKENLYLHANKSKSCKTIVLIDQILDY